MWRHRVLVSACPIGEDIVALFSNHSNVKPLDSYQNIMYFSNVLLPHVKIKWANSFDVLYLPTCFCFLFMKFILHSDIYKLSSYSVPGEIKQSILFLHCSVLVQI